MIDTYFICKAETLHLTERSKDTSLNIASH